MKKDNAQPKTDPLSLTKCKAKLSYIKGVWRKFKRKKKERPHLFFKLVFNSVVRYKKIRGKSW